MAFGAIAGRQPGDIYDDYAALIEADLHRQRNVGIVGGTRNGAESIVLSGGYKDDRDMGQEIIYTGEGGQDGSRNQVDDQEWVGKNEGLRVNMARGTPIRVIRGRRGDPRYSPPSGYRYDGLYAVVDAWRSPSRDGPFVCQVKLVKTDGWTVPLSSGATEPQPAPRVPATTSRIVRDTATANAVKALHNYTCQVCRQRLVLPGGAAYAEGAHIRALGVPHNGPDVMENVLCLCPNDHVRFDHGALYLTDTLVVTDAIASTELGRLRLVKSHPIELRYVAYHRGLFGY
jgi:putative restriction endonuclease